MSSNYDIPWWLRGKETACQCRRLGQKDPLEKEMAAHSSIVAWRIPRTGEPHALQPTGLQKSQTGLITWIARITLVHLDTTVTLCKYMFCKYFLQVVACHFISFSRATAFIKIFFKWSVLFVSYLGSLSTFYLQVFFFK